MKPKRTYIFWLSSDRLSFQAVSLLEQPRNRQMRTMVKLHVNSMENNSSWCLPPTFETLAWYLHLLGWTCHQEHILFVQSQGGTLSDTRDWQHQVASRRQLVGLEDSSSEVRFLHLLPMHYRDHRGKLGAQQLVHGIWNWIRSPIMPWYDTTHFTKNSPRMGSPSTKRNTSRRSQVLWWERTASTLDGVHRRSSSALRKPS